MPGTFVAGWNDGAFKMKRFAYGRFQYELCTYNWENDFVTSCGKVLKVGDTYVNFHIPSSGIPLTDEVRLASYKEAYKHYKHLSPTERSYSAAVHGFSIPDTVSFCHPTQTF